jgi:hypothetical protein
VIIHGKSKKKIIEVLDELRFFIDKKVIFGENKNSVGLLSVVQNLNLYQPLWYWNFQIFLLLSVHSIRQYVPWKSTSGYATHFFFIFFLKSVARPDSKLNLNHIWRKKKNCFQKFYPSENFSMIYCFGWTAHNIWYVILNFKIKKKKITSYLE